MIVNKFHRNYDPSYFWQILSSNFNNLESIGRGFHFSNFKVVAQGSFPFALSIARPGFLVGLVLDEWVNALKLLKEVRHPLIPPMEFGVHDETAYYITPYCAENITSRKALKDPLQSLSEALRKKRLYVDDYWQVKLMDGHPFVIDWSDLKMSKF